MKFSIIIPVFNKINFTLKTLDSLFFLPEDDTEIIIFDNHSTDETNKKIAGIDRKNYRYILNEINEGFAAACNKAYSQSNGDNVLFLNNDIKIEDKNNWLISLEAAIEMNPDCLIGPTAGYVDPLNNFRFCYETNDANKKINYMSGWCIAAKRKTWNKLKLEGCSGPFDDRSFFVFFEDTDLGFRAKQLGINFQLVSLPIKHIGHISSNQLNTYKLYNESRQIFLEKWKGKITQ